jgi:hypothetical protein
MLHVQRRHLEFIDQVRWDIRREPAWCYALSVSSSARFFQDLVPLPSFRDAVDPRHYKNAPRDWSVILTDVVGSTKAVAAGRYKDVNALGAGSIIAVCNALPEVDLPFVFGGDGATLLVPNDALDTVRGALRGLRGVAEQAFDLSLRCGVVPVSTLEDAGGPIGVAKYAPSPHITLALWRKNG